MKRKRGREWVQACRPTATRTTVCSSGNVGVARFDIAWRMRSSTPRTVIARAVARRPVLRSRRFAGIEREKLEITDGLDSLLVFGEEDLNDTRCGVCGSLLFSVVRDGAYVRVAMGSLVNAPGIRPTEHIFVGSDHRNLVLQHHRWFVSARNSFSYSSCRRIHSCQASPSSRPFGAWSRIG